MRTVVLLSLLLVATTSSIDAASRSPLERPPFVAHVTDADLKAEEIILEELSKANVYACYSKESPKFTMLNKEGDYIVTFDPIDGGKVIDANMTVSSIFGIWATNDIEGKSGRDLVGAVVTLYGSRTSMLLYNSHSKTVEELTLIKI